MADKEKDPGLELKKMLPQCKSKNMSFAFRLNGSGGTLYLSPGAKKVEKDEYEEEKGALFTGICHGPMDNLVFECFNKPPPKNLGECIKKGANAQMKSNLIKTAHAVSKGETVEDKK